MMPSRALPTLCGAICWLGLMTAAPAAATVWEVDCTFPAATCASLMQAKIQDAVTCAGVGDTVVVHPCAVGTYNENVVISGAGKDRVHLVGAQVLAGGPSTVGAAKCGVGAGLSFKPAVIIDGSGLGGSCVSIDSNTGVSVVGFQMINCFFHGVHVRATDDTVIQGNRMQRSRGAGVVLEGTQDAQAVCNLMFQNRLEGVRLEDAIGTLVGDNAFIRNRAAGLLMAFGSGFDNHVCNNESIANTLEGIVVSGGEARIERNTATGNGGIAELFIDPGSLDADVVGNDLGGAPTVDAGVGTEMHDNFF